MTREELEETVASTICCHTRMSPAAQWEIDLLMSAIDKHLAPVLNERDQYASAIRQLIVQVKQTAYVWSQTLPETIPTAEVVKALGLLAPRPLPEGLRDDMWQRIVAAYYLRFENDGHPEDSKAAADEAMALVKPELDRRDAEIARLRERLQLLTDETVARVAGPNIELLCGEIHQLRSSVAQALAVAEVIEANGITWAADSIRRALNGEAA
jgi:hypothetical protein